MCWTHQTAVSSCTKGVEATILHLDASIIRVHMFVLCLGCQLSTLSCFHIQPENPAEFRLDMMSRLMSDTL